MKNQYVGDINDYAKYSILLELNAVGLSIGICWMLTNNDDRPDGRRISYLNNDEYRKYCPVVYDVLKDIVESGRRSVFEIQKANIFPGAVYCNRIEDIWHFEDIDLLFLDPDNGFEVKSIGREREGSERYVFWEDISSVFYQGCSLMVYQHFPRVNRVRYMENLSLNIRRNICTSTIFHVHTNIVDFVIIPQVKHEKKIKVAIDKLNSRQSVMTLKIFEPSRTWVM